LEGSPGIHFFPSPRRNGANPARSEGESCAQSRPGCQRETGSGSDGRRRAALTVEMQSSTCSCAHFSREFCGSPVAQASACVVLICAGAEKSTQTEVCATRGALALRLNPTQRVANREPTPWVECQKCGRVGTRQERGFDALQQDFPKIDTSIDGSLARDTHCLRPDKR
jgi:hypothetical protein